MSRRGWELLHDRKAWLNPIHEEGFCDRNHRHRHAKTNIPTPRQMEVLMSRFRQGSRKEGAAALGISEFTAREHIRELCRRIGADNAEHAVYLLWLKDMWGDDDGPSRVS